MPVRWEGNENYTPRREGPDMKALGLGLLVLGGGAALVVNNGLIGEENLDYNLETCVLDTEITSELTNRFGQYVIDESVPDRNAEWGDTVVVAFPDANGEYGGLEIEAMLKDAETQEDVNNILREAAHYEQGQPLYRCGEL